MRSISFLALGAIALGVVTGCSSKEDNLLGIWKYKSQIFPETVSDNPGASMRQSFISTIHVEFKSDHTFNITPIFVLGGTWRLAGNTVIMTMKTVNGLTLEQQKKKFAKNPLLSARLAKEGSGKDWVATLSSDGKLLTFTPQASSRGGMVLEKASS